MKKRICILLAVLYVAPSFAAKAICTAKHIKTGQVFKAMVGSRSYNVAVKQSKRQALLGCLSRSKNKKYCRLVACYRRN